MDRKVRPRVTGIARLCSVKPNSDHEGLIFYLHQTTMIDFFSCIPFDFNLGVIIYKCVPLLRCRHIEKI